MTIAASRWRSHVENGEIDGVDVSGRSFVMVADTPPNMADGNWRVGVIVDDGANEEQVGKFGQVLSGCSSAGRLQRWGRCSASSSASSRRRSASSATGRATA